MKAARRYAKEHDLIDVLLKAARSYDKNMM